MLELYVRDTVPAFNRYSSVILIGKCRFLSVKTLIKATAIISAVNEEVDIVAIKFYLDSCLDILGKAPVLAELASSYTLATASHSAAVEMTFGSRLYCGYAANQIIYR